MCYGPDTLQRRSPEMSKQSDWLRRPSKKQVRVDNLTQWYMIDTAFKPRVVIRYTRSSLDIWITTSILCGISHIIYYQYICYQYIIQARLTIPITKSDCIFLCEKVHFHIGEGITTGKRKKPTSLYKFFHHYASLTHKPKKIIKIESVRAYLGHVHTCTCTLQWSFYFKTIHGVKKMRSYIAGGLKIKVI